MDMPYSSVPDAMDPSTKYLMADSAAMPESRSNATMAYRHSDISSSPRYSVIKLAAEISTMAPRVANSPSTKYSPLRMARRCKIVGGIDEYHRDYQQRDDLQHLRHAVQFEQSAQRDDFRRQRLHDHQHRRHAAD